MFPYKPHLDCYRWILWQSCNKADWGWQPEGGTLCCRRLPVWQIKGQQTSLPHVVSIWTCCVVSFIYLSILIVFKIKQQRKLIHYKELIHISESERKCGFYQILCMILKAVPIFMLKPWLCGGMSGPVLIDSRPVMGIDLSNVSL